MQPMDESWELARQACYAQIRESSFHYESYHALFELYREAGWTDAAYCIASTLGFLKKATAEQEAYVEEHGRREFQMARQRLTEDTLRRHVFHPDQDLYLTGVLGLIAPAVAAWRAVELPVSLRPKASPRPAAAEGRPAAEGRSLLSRMLDRMLGRTPPSVAAEPLEPLTPALGGVDISTDPALFSRMAKYVKEVLDVVQPDVYLRPEEMGDLTLMNIKRDNRLCPTMVVFLNLLEGKAEPQLAFALGRYMIDLYLPHFGFVALDRSPQALKMVFMACLHAVGLPVQGDLGALDQIAREIFVRMQPAAREQLRGLLPKLIEAGANPDVKRWVAAAELTAYRVGLLLAGDLRVAGQMISQEQAPLGVGVTMSPRDKIKELVLYSISEDYFIARRAIGVDAQ